MDTHPDDLSEIERRLAAWRPAEQGLDADAMLFAAGRAAGRQGGVWPALACGLAVLAAVLGAWGVSERAGRLALAERPRPPAPASAPQEQPAPPAEELSPSSLHAARRAIERGLDTWAAPPVEPSGPPAPDAPALQLGQRHALLDP